MGFFTKFWRLYVSRNSDTAISLISVLRSLRAKKLSFWDMLLFNDLLTKVRWKDMLHLGGLYEHHISIFFKRRV